MLLTFCGTASAKKGPAFPIENLGTEFPVVYEKYGDFSGAGTDAFRFKLTDKSGLEKAVGVGLFPSNGASLQSDPTFQKWRKKKSPNMNPWDYVDSNDPQSDFYVWAYAGNVGPGTKLFFTAQALANGGHLTQALKAYYSVLIHFPKEPCWSADQSFVWYLGGEVLNRIETLTSQHPELGVRLEGAVFSVKNGDDTDLNNDEFVIHPGRWVSRGAVSGVSLKDLKVIQTRGSGRVQLVQYENLHWQMKLDGKPYIVRGVTYNPTKVGRDMSDTKGNDWMFEDANQNGRIDVAYDSWVDRNSNNRQDSGEWSMGDFKLMKDMGVNTIRMYRLSQSADYNPKEFNKPLLRDLSKNYGIRILMGDLLGAYTVGSGADWNEGTDYTDPAQLKRMRALVKAFVNDHKNEDYVLGWLLGNENLMKGEYGGVNATRTKASEQIEAYLNFVNEIAEMIHRIDPNHPVAVGNLGLNGLEEHGRYAPAVDIFGCNLYLGGGGFGQTWKKIQKNFDRPVLITEYGCDAFNSKMEREDEISQANYHRGNWKNIDLNAAGGPETGNAIGGIAFEFIDEWWKSPSGSWDVQDDVNDSPMAFPDGWSSEEYLGLVSQGDGSKSPFLRKLRKAYTLYRNELWKN